MKLYRMAEGSFVEQDGRFFAVEVSRWDELIGLERNFERKRLRR